MTINRLPLVSSVDPDAYATGVITSGSGTLNTLYTKYPGEKLYAGQRPSLRVTTEPADTESTDTQGRGVTFWNEVGDFYFVTGRYLYRSSYSGPIQDLGSVGRDKVFFAEVNDKLILIDPSENKGWILDKALPSSVTEITDADFPPNQGPSLQLAGGAVSLDGYLFVMTTDGRLWNSNLNAPETWSAINFITADVSPDGGVAIFKHHNHICAIGQDSIEFFFDAGNPVGSPLQLRQDTSYLTGALDYNTISSTGGDILFLGREVSGTIGLHRLKSFKLERVSSDSIDMFINDTYTADSSDGDPMSFVVSSAWAGGHLLTFITSVGISVDNYKPKYTLVYDATTSLWGSFSSDLVAVEEFAVMGSTDPKGTTGGRGSLIFLSGALATVDFSGEVSDYKLNYGYFEDGYIEEGYMVPPLDDVVAPITMEIVTVEYDMESSTNKTQHRMSLIGTTPASSEDLTPVDISWTDDRYRTFSPERPIDTGLRRSLTRGGTFKRRAYSVKYTGLDRLRLEFIELDTRVSQYA